MSRNIVSYGTGKVAVNPNSMELNFRLEYEDLSYEKALHALRKAHLNVLRVFSEQGFDNGLVKTAAVNIDRIRPHDKDEIYIRLSQRFVYRGPIDLEKLSALLDSFSSEEHLDFNFNYYIDNPRKSQNEALILAMKDAKFKAQMMAKEMDVTLVELDELSELETEVPQMLRAMQADYVSMNPDELQISKTVKTVWKIK